MYFQMIFVWQLHNRNKKKKANDELVSKGDIDVTTVMVNMHKETKPSQTKTSKPLQSIVNDLPKYSCSVNLFHSGGSGLF
jgi:hypothetical protein